MGQEIQQRRHDIIAALGAHALAGPAARQRLVLRLITLMAARFNWVSGTVSIGRAELARLWAVDPRSVRRELARLRAAGWLAVRRKGVRGRVTLYALDLGRILADTAPDWPALGPDFRERLSALAARMAPDSAPPVADAAGAPSARVLAFPGTAPATAGPAPGPAAAAQGAWAAACARLRAEDPDTFRAWFARLQAEPDPACADALVLRAQSRFVASYLAAHHASRIGAALAAAAPGLARWCIAPPAG
ncbi:MAG: hypothetical protein D6754_12025 [Alphaproteobacteria bacterium]|nr:MAG: hypothetical protein D6754_12025 [Alphaproteobacteria bacterium]